MSFFSDAESSIQALFAATNKGFQLDASTGLGQIDSWIQYLRSGDSKTFGPLVHELETLRTHIGNNNAAGMAVAFQNLGQLTAQAASNTHSFQGDGDKARELSQKLVTAAGNLRLLANAPSHH